MRGLICLFRPHRWTWVLNYVRTSVGLFESYGGIYQCSRCKTISIGQALYDHTGSSQTSPETEGDDAGKDAQGRKGEG